MSRFRHFARHRWTARCHLLAIVAATFLWPSALFADDCARDWRRAED